MAATELLSPSSFNVASASFSNFEKLLRSLHMRCDAPYAMTHFGAATAAAARGEAVSQEGSQSSVVVRAAVALAFFTFHHSFICF